MSARKVIPIIEGLIGPPKCPTCRGGGKVYDTTRGPYGDEEICPTCFGEGDAPDVPSQGGAPNE
jgi:DnaJ-class molecular chaperone